MDTCFVTFLRIVFDFICAAVAELGIVVVLDDEVDASFVVDLVSGFPYTVCERDFLVVERVTAGIFECSSGDYRGVGCQERAMSRGKG